MFDTNSVVIEGIVSGELAAIELNGVCRCCFVLRNVNARNGELNEQDPQIRVVPMSAVMVNTALRNVTDGRGVCVTGMIAGNIDSGAYIAAEDIEYR
jgi:hypothetical protein